MRDEWGFLLRKKSGLPFDYLNRLRERIGLKLTARAVSLIAFAAVGSRAYYGESLL